MEISGARVCGPRNGNRSSSILAVAFEDRYTLRREPNRWEVPTVRALLPGKSKALQSRVLLFRLASFVGISRSEIDRRRIYICMHLRDEEYCKIL